MKKLLQILSFLFIGFTVIGQQSIPTPPPAQDSTNLPKRWQRSSYVVTPDDPHLIVSQNFTPPVYDDTAQANIYKSYDSCGSFIWTRDIQGYWQRKCDGGKHWSRVTPPLPNTVLSGGLVSYIDSLHFYVTEAFYVLEGEIFHFPGGDIYLDSADVSCERIDDIILDRNGANSLKGTPNCGNALEPTVNPQTQLRRALVRIPANSPTPAGFNQFSVFNENTDLPTEWHPSTTGSVDFSNTQFVYKGFFSARINSLTNGQVLDFTYSDTVHSGNKISLIGFVRLGGDIPADVNLNVQLTYQGVPVTTPLPLTSYGLSRSSSVWQMWGIPMSEFSSGDMVFDGIRFTKSGISTLPAMNLDLIQFQSGFTLVATIPNQKFGHPKGDNFGSEDRSFNANGYDYRLFNTKKYIHTIPFNQDSAWMVLRQDGSPMMLIDPFNGIVKVNQFNSGDIFRVNATSANLDGHVFSVNNGGFLQGYQQKLSLQKGFALVSDSTIVEIVNSDTLGLYNIDSALYKSLSIKFRSPIDDKIREKFVINSLGDVWAAHMKHSAFADSFMVWKNGFYQATTLAEMKAMISPANIGSGYRLFVPYVGQAKSLFGSYALTLDSTTNVNGITFKLDTAAIRAYLGVGGPGSGSVSTVTTSDGNGFDFTTINNNTTPQISLTTTLTQNRIPLIGAGGALTEDAGFTWDATNKRLQTWLTPVAGSTTNATMKFPTGSLLTTPQNGAWEYDGVNLYFTIGATRKQINDQPTAGVGTLNGTPNQIIVSNPTGTVTLSLPQSIATNSNVTFQRLTLSGAAATANAIFSSHTDPAAAAGVFTNNGTRLAFSFATTYKRFALTNDLAPTAGQIMVGDGTGNYNIGAITANGNDVVVTSTSTGVTVGLNESVVTLTDGPTVNANANNSFNFKWTLTGTNRTLVIQNPKDGRSYNFYIFQDATGNRTITTWPSGIKWKGGVAPTLVTQGNRMNLVVIQWIAGQWIGSYDTSPYF